MLRLWLCLAGLLISAAAYAQVSPQPANQFWATPSNTTGYLGLRAMSPKDMPFTQAGTGATAQTMQAWGRRFCVTPNDFGAVGDGSTDDTAAVNAAITASIVGSAQHAKCLYLPGGYTYSVPTADITITMPANSVGPVIYGDGGYNSQIKMGAGKLSIVSSTAMFYGDLRDFSVVCSVAGPCLKLSASTTDALNGFNISGVVINNNSANAANIGTQFNGVYNSNINMTSNCSGAGNGIGIQVEAGTMNKWQTSASQCLDGINLTNAVNSVSGNVFTGNDLEVNSVGLFINGSAVTNNTFMGGVFAFNSGGTYGINATAGSNNLIVNPYYGGAGSFCNNTVGIVFAFTPGLGTGVASTCPLAPMATLTDTDQLLTGGFNVTTLNSGSKSGNYQIDCGLGPLQTIINGTSAITLLAPTVDGQCSLQVQGTSNTQAVTFSNMSVSPTGFGDTYVTSLSKTATVTITIASPGVITWTGHMLVQNNVVYCQSTGALPTGLTAFNNYYVNPTGANTFTLSATPGGTAINTSGSQSGTQTCSVPPVFNLYVERHNGMTTANWKQSQ